jgi:predicted SAM-dependent methyltransferase
MSIPIKLNLGCGHNHKADYVNVDKYGQPDICHDLEIFPWPWAENTVAEIILNHVLEHLGESNAVYLKIIQEMYRICAPGAIIRIAVPHPRSDEFINDPTHVRVITPAGLDLFSKAKNNAWMENGFANSPLGLYLDVDFEIESVNYSLEPAWSQKLKTGDCTQEDIYRAMRSYNNVVTEIRMQIRVIK